MTQSRHLFVYGTLRPSADAYMGRAMRRRLALESDLLGSASLPGRLVNLGRYPGMMEIRAARSLAGGGLVRGDVLALTDPEETWPWLDAYEGYDPDRPDDSLYHRTARTVTLDAGGAVDAWVYLLASLPKHFRFIASGDWLDQ